MLAQDEARGLGHAWIGPEHLALGLLREERGLAARVLMELGATLDAARDRLVESAGRAEPMTPSQIPFTPEAKRSLEQALRAAQSMRHHFIGTEHLLLGLDEKGAATLGLGRTEINEAVIRTIGGESTGAGWEFQLDSLSPLEPVDPLLEQLVADGWEILSIRVERRRRRRPTR